MAPKSYAPPPEQGRRRRQIQAEWQQSPAPAPAPKKSAAVLAAEEKFHAAFEAAWREVGPLASQAGLEEAVKKYYDDA